MQWIKGPQGAFVKFPCSAAIRALHSFPFPPLGRSDAGLRMLLSCRLQRCPSFCPAVPFPFNQPCSLPTEGWPAWFQNCPLHPTSLCGFRYSPPRISSCWLPSMGVEVVRRRLSVLISIALPFLLPALVSLPTQGEVSRPRSPSPPRATLVACPRAMLGLHGQQEPEGTSRCWGAVLCSGDLFPQFLPSPRVLKCG